MALRSSDLRLGRGRYRPVAMDILAAALAATLAAVLFRFPPDIYPIYPVCPVRALTGMLCPGCGATRALSHLLHGEIAAALQQNALATLLLPPALLSAFVPGLRRMFSSLTLRSPVSLLLALAVTLFTIYRNTRAF